MFARLLLLLLEYIYMKLIIEQSNLVTKLNSASRFTANKSSSPLLSGYYLSALKDNQLIIRTSSGSVVYESRVEAKVESVGSCAVPAGLMLSIIKSLEAGEIEFNLTEDSLEIVQKRSRSQISIMLADNFPDLHRDQLKEKLVLPVEEFVKYGQRVLIAASTDETKPVLTSLAMEMSQPNALVTTDGFRLYRNQVDLSLDEEGRFLLPARVLKDFFAILEKDSASTITCWTDSDRQEILFDLGETALQVSAIQGEFPPYQSIIPDNVAFSLQVDKESLVQRVNQAMIFAREFSSIIVFDMDKKDLVISSQTNTKGKTESRLTCNSIEGEPVRFACNGKYVQDYLNATEAEEIRIQGNESLKPVLFSDAESDRELYLIMPFKLQE